MEITFNYKEVPNGFMHCANEACTQSGDCLRHLAFKKLPADQPSISWLNPAYISQQKKCTYFKSNTPACLALGITQMFDNLPYTKAKIIRKIMQSYFGRSTYYRIYNKQYFIKPDAQEFIRETFRKQGIETDPIYDELTYRYMWGDNTETQLVS